MDAERRIGDRVVASVGFGAMALSFRSGPSEVQALATIDAALEAGVTFVDTADCYAPAAGATGHNERLIATALRRRGARLDDVLVGTKGGQYLAAEGGFPINGRPEYLRAACEQSLRNLGVDCIGLYQHHRPDPAVPYAESIGAIAALKREGKIRLVGVSNVSMEQLDEARAIVDIVAVQNPYSPDNLGESEVLRRCEQLGIAFLAYSPFGGRNAARGLGDRHPVLGAVAADHGASIHRVALAWLLALSPVLIPLPGARRPETARDSAGAGCLLLTADELERLGSN